MNEDAYILVKDLLESAKHCDSQSRVKYYGYSDYSKGSKNSNTKQTK